MWHRLGEWVLRNRLILLIILGISTIVMGYYASRVEMSYEFTRAIPIDNPKYQAYLSFKQKFGEDGNLIAVGFQTDSMFTPKLFNALSALHDDMKTVDGVEEVLSLSSAVALIKNDSTEKLIPKLIFPKSVQSQAEMDSCRDVFLNLPFYKGLLYNPDTKTYLMGVRVSTRVINSKLREKTVGGVETKALAFGTANHLDIKLSGLPLIRNNMATRIAREMKWFLAGSIVFSAIILLIFFRSFSTMILSLSVVIIGVIFSMATIYLCGFKISLLNALIPPLVVVIGVPNCIYFLNKYHTSYIKKTDKRTALVDMVSKMGIVTLFCNISAAIGFAVFSFTKSAVLKEFGIVAGINIMALFFISLILLPAALSYLPQPKSRHLNYLENKWLTTVLTRIEIWVFNHRKIVYAFTVVIMLVSVTGMLKLRSEGYIVDDLPKTDKIYADLKFFESNFKGIMPLEIIVDTKRKNGLTGMRALNTYAKIDSFSQSIAGFPEFARPLSLAEGLKFAKQSFYDGDSANYLMPNAFDGAFVGDYLKARRDSSNQGTVFQKLISSFIDTNRQTTRLSLNMADVGSKKLPILLDTLQMRASQYFDTSAYKVEFTGTTITFLEGSRFIISGLKDSIIWAFALISLCMLYLFKSFRILICSLIPNIIPLLLTAGIMGWVGIALKPSTVLVFSVALGIAIDVTIRFLVNYKQELPTYNYDVEQTVMHTIRQTGISIIYTSLVLIAGFIIFVFSGFGGTKALGWLTSLTLLSATLTNLILLPVLLISFNKKNVRPDQNKK
ncbi:efflux RND transporter permease subunit [Pollutibacter soli]|uniref:efflux RND transporter permease subunit n=1 Tax=Pollutibacter soli TaxID=3034157 RepID=UPI0030134F84